jgi:hypothetical protein
MIHLHTKNTKKKVKKNGTIVYAQTALHFALNIGGISAQSHMLLFVICFPANLIRLLHCKAMYFDSFSLGARHLFQKVVLFFNLFSYLRH